jgi:hypothetical protein
VDERLDVGSHPGGLSQTPLRRSTGVRLVVFVVKTHAVCAGSGLPPGRARRALSGCRAVAAEMPVVTRTQVQRYVRAHALVRRRGTARPLCVTRRGRRVNVLEANLSPCEELVVIWSADLDLPERLGRAWWIAIAITFSRPLTRGRRKSVTLLIPTACWPRSLTASYAPRVANVLGVV